MPLSNRAVSQWPFRLGDRVEVIGDIDYLPYTIVRKGEFGTVVYVSDNQTLIELDAYHHYQNAGWCGLGNYDNCLSVIPDDPTVDAMLTKLLTRERTTACRTALSLVCASQWWQETAKVKH